MTFRGRPLLRAVPVTLVPGVDTLRDEGVDDPDVDLGLWRAPVGLFS